MNDQPMLEWFRTSIDAVPMEQLRGVLGAIIDHLGLTIEQKNWYDDGPEFRVAPKEPEVVGARNEF